LFRTMHTIVAVCVLIGLLIYIWACVGVQIITTQKDGFEGEAKDVVDYYFYDLYSTMRSLIQFINFDDSSSLYTPLMQSKPYLSIFFISFMMVVGLAVMNLLTAVIVEGALEQARKDIEVQDMYEREVKKRMLPRLLKMFAEIDTNGDGEITREEISAAPEEVHENIRALVKLDDLNELFDILDKNDEGAIGIKDFFEGLGKIVSSRTPIDLIRVLTKVDSLRHHQVMLHDCLIDFLDRFEPLLNEEAVAPFRENLRKTQKRFTQAIPDYSTTKRRSTYTSRTSDSEKLLSF